MADNVVVTFLQAQARLLILLHAIVAMVLLGASTHASIVVIGTLRDRPRPRLARIYAIVTLVAYVLVMVLGALAYPTYRYHVRGLYLDRYAHWASNLFDIKENVAGIGLPLAFGAFVLRVMTDPDRDAHLRSPLAVMTIGSAVIVWFAVVSGLVISLERGV